MQRGSSKEVKQAFANALRDAINVLYPSLDINVLQIEGTIDVPDSSNGDLTSSVSFRIAKLLKKRPSDIAKSVISHLQYTKYIYRFEELNGYINAFIDEKDYSTAVLASVFENQNAYGSSGVGKNEKVMVESPAVNPNKAWHVGHLRNALLGDTISNLLDFCSYRVEREDYIDDLGLQMAETVWGWLNMGDKQDKKFDLWLGEQYVEVNKKIEESVRVKEDIDLLLKRMESVDSEESKIAREIAEKSVLAQAETAFSYGVYHDVMVWESDIVRAELLSRALEIAIDKGVVEEQFDGKYAGCFVVKFDRLSRFAKELEGAREDAKVVIRSNGAATYIAKDFAFHMWKFGLIESRFRYKKFLDEQRNGKPLFSTAPSGTVMNFGNAKRTVNIIGAEQCYEQMILKLMFILLGHTDCADNLIHLAYGLVRIPEGGLSTRSGTWIGKNRSYTADDLLREVKSKAMGMVTKSEKIGNKDSADEISNRVALAAIKFEFLRVAPEKEIVFSWKRALDFEGNSGPYCLYTYARASRILEKAGAFTPPRTYQYVSRGCDFELIKLIGMFQEVAEKACNEYRPNVITDYLLDLASTFSKFYETMPVLKGGDAMQERLAMVSATRRVIRNALALLGIGVVERM